MTRLQRLPISLLLHLVILLLNLELTCIFIVAWERLFTIVLKHLAYFLSLLHEFDRVLRAFLCLFFLRHHRHRCLLLLTFVERVLKALKEVGVLSFLDALILPYILNSGNCFSVIGELYLGSQLLILGIIIEAHYSGHPVEER